MAFLISFHLFLLYLILCSLIFPSSCSCSHSHSDSCITLQLLFGCQIFYSFTVTLIQFRTKSQNAQNGCPSQWPSSPLPFTQNSVGSCMFPILPMTCLAPSVSKNTAKLKGRVDMATTVQYVCHLGQTGSGSQSHIGQSECSQTAMVCLDWLQACELHILLVLIQMLKLTVYVNQNSILQLNQVVNGECMHI